MLYNILANLVELHKEALAVAVAKKALARNLPSYTNQTIAALAPKFWPTLEMLARYVRDGDPSEYRDYIATLTRTRLSQGYKAEDFYIMGELLTEAIRELIDKETQVDAKIKISWQRRLNGIQTLAQTTVVASRFNR
jgi:hemoglobin-like flavoprotein